MAVTVDQIGQLWRVYRLCVVKTPSGSKFKRLSAGTGTHPLL